jgi:hypothetical protein
VELFSSNCANLLHTSILTPAPIIVKQYVLT